MPEISVAKTITVVTLPEPSRALLLDGQLKEALEPAHFSGEEDALGLVREFVDQLSEPQSGLLLLGLQHAIGQGEGHDSAVHFLELESPLEIAGVGLEIRNDTVIEEKVFSPVRVMFVRFQPPEA